ncbi:hypothetical protein QR680_016070 [Steinernema hermaphroditum]|uniref:Uncharacterized protein n=1 Tax=Steinernema hermaphroditum TaxID=289476 RepID=A0AA39LLP9_9BILA|nr:hypothetical protein QR680_016070 [Steinernema hermaphroditum]
MWNRAESASLLELQSFQAVQLPLKIMDLYLFHRDKYEYFYNCSMYTEEEWSKFGIKRPGLGIFSIVIGVLAIILYIPCARAMLRPKLWQLPCYKLMFLNAVIDIWGIINSCFISGYLSVEGVVFCSYPDFLYITGSIIMALWGAQCVTAVILALNRCIEFWQKPFLTRLFEGYNMIFWFMLPITWFFVLLMFTASIPFTSILNMWVLDPYFGIPGIKADGSWYAQVTLLNINNMFVFVGLTSCYLFLVFSIWFRSRSVGSAVLSKVQRQVSIQACIICSFIYFTGGTYVFFEFFPEFASPLFLIMDFLGWQWGFCGVIMIYMVMNKNLRRGVLSFYLNIFGYDVSPDATTTAAVSHMAPKSSAVHLDSSSLANPM